MIATTLTAEIRRRRGKSWLAGALIAPSLSDVPATKIKRFPDTLLEP